ncbi:hypothetical protein ABZ805_22770, partial [Saccharopolyspora sp. NPDC047091]|uniref:hypothetical protein n=1 Tax=Saccharopolyspora sp. NPDC047091 TaxID=3155924 RepID=UPI003404AD01
MAELLGESGSGTSVAFSLRDLFPKWLRHEGKSCPREKATENEDLTADTFLAAVQAARERSGN